MTTKQDPVEIDAYNLMLHAAQQGESLERYQQRVIRMVRKKIKRISEGLILDD